MSISIFKHAKKDKQVDPVKAAKIQVKTQKKQAKAAKKAASSKGSLFSKVAGSAISTALSPVTGVLGAATYHYYMLSGVNLAMPSISDPTLGLGLATLGSAAIATIAHTHSALKSISKAPSEDKAMTALTSDVEELKAKIGGISPVPQSSLNADMSSLNAKIDSLNKKLDGMGVASAQVATSAPKAQATHANHVAK